MKSSGLEPYEPVNLLICMEFPKGHSLTLSFMNHGFVQ